MNDRILGVAPAATLLCKVNKKAKQHFWKTEVIWRRLNGIIQIERESSN